MKVEQSYDIFDWVTSAGQSISAQDLRPDLTNINPGQLIFHVGKDK